MKYAFHRNTFKGRKMRIPLIRTPGLCLIRLISGLLLFSAILVMSSQARAGGWWNTGWRFRLPVTIGAAGYDRTDKPAEVAVNFTQQLAALAQSGSLDENSLRVIEVDATGNVVNPSVAFQFDKDTDYDAATKASGSIVLIMDGTTSSGTARYYHIYFETTGGSFSPPSIPAQITLTDDVQFEGQASYQIATQNATYLYHKQGAAFAGMKDKNNNEWIGYHPTGGSDGAYRGIPNMVYNPPDPGFFHPGFTNSASDIPHQGPVKLTIHSKSTDPGNPWECKWEMYPNYATMTVLTQGNSSFWFLYEGTPGGSFETATDYTVRSTGQRSPTSDSWIGAIPAPEFVYFGDQYMRRVLYAVHHENDSQIDSYRQQDDLMTVFGFGRDLTVGSYLNSAPQHFTIGFAEDSAFTVTSKVIAASYQPLSITPGSPEQLSVLSAPSLVSPVNDAVNQSTSLTLTWNSVSGAATYHVQVATNATFTGGVVVDDSSLTGTSKSLSSLSGGTKYYWRVSAKNASALSPYSTSWNFTTAVAAPVLLSPPNGASAQPTNVTLSWTAATGAIFYHLQVGTDQTFASGLFVDDSTVAGTSRAVLGLAGTTTYYWRVSTVSAGGASSYSPTWNFTTSIAAPTLVGPLNNAVGQSLALTFSWRSAPGATNYHLQLATDSTFGGGFIKNDSTITDTERVVVGLQHKVRYFWRVAALVGGGSSGYSPTWSFTTIGIIPAQVQLIAPADGATGVPDTVRVVWFVSQPAVTRYWLEVSFDSLFSIRMIDSMLTDTTKGLRGLLEPLHTYWWRVRSANSEGWGPLSNIRSFTTKFFTGVEQTSDIPHSFDLSQNYPNPFNPSTLIEFSLPKEGFVKLEVYSTLGERVASLVEGNRQAGVYRVQFDASGLASGLYFYRLTANDAAFTKKMMLLK